nr:MAG TPA: hypothetical protein [Caudoviricetes sp.]
MSPHGSFLFLSMLFTPFRGIRHDDPSYTIVDFKSTLALKKIASLSQGVKCRSFVNISISLALNSVKLWTFL